MTERLTARQVIALVAEDFTELRPGDGPRRPGTGPTAR